MFDYSKYMTLDKDFILGYEEINNDNLLIHKNTGDICLNNNTEEEKNKLNKQMINQIKDVDSVKLYKDILKSYSLYTITFLSGVVSSCISIVYLLDKNPLAILFAVLALIAYYLEHKGFNEVLAFQEDYQKCEEYIKYKEELEKLCKEEVTSGFNINSLDSISLEELKQMRKVLEVLKQCNFMNNTESKER